MLNKFPSRHAGPAAWLLCSFAMALPGPALADDAELVARGKALFTTVKPACAVCHTLAAAGSEGQVGPVLDELKPDAARVLQALQSGLGVMPSYAEQLSETDMRALAAFVSHSTGGAPLAR
jgi:mono/diheme cytochrome c family protein